MKLGALTHVHAHLESLTHTDGNLLLCDYRGQNDNGRS